MTAITRPMAPRRGFTLVELLVAMALIIFIMVILTEAFSAGTGVFRTLKAQGDMQEKLRATISLMRDDLRQSSGKQTHFGDNDPVRLSTLGVNGNLAAPGQGYFYIQQPPQPFLPNTSFGSMPEGPANQPNPPGVPGPQALEFVDQFSVRMNTPLLQVNQGQFVVAQPAPAGPAAGPQGASWAAFLPALCFTNYRRGTQPTDYFAARVPGLNPDGVGPKFLTSEQSIFDGGFAVALQTNPKAPINPPVDYQQPLPLLRTQQASITPQPPLPMRTQPDQQSGLLLSHWSEIGYFLVATGRTAGTTTPMPTYSLRRRLRVVLTDPNLSQGLNTGTDQHNLPVQQVPANLWGSRYAEVSCYPNTSNPNNPVLYFNTPKDLINPPGPPPQGSLYPPCGINNKGCQVLVPPPGVGPAQQSLVRFNDPATPQGAVPQGPPNGTWAGDDIILTDVISFNLRVLAFFPNANNGQGQYSNDFLDLTDPSLNLPVPGFYNSATPPPPPPNMTLPNCTIAALEITLRVWDVKTSQTRQVTLIQDM